MEQMEKYRREEAKRLIEWIIKNDSDWLAINLAFNDQDALNAAEFKEAIKLLRKSGFYQLLVMLCYSNNDAIRKTIEKSILSCVNDNWNEELPDKIIDMLLLNLKES